MIDIVQKENICANLHNEISQVMSKYYANELKKSDQGQTEYLKSACDDLSPILIGQEKDNILLYTWTQEESSFAKTFVAFYDLSLCKARLIFTQEKVIYIINGSVNADLTMLAFSVRQCENSNGFDSPTDDGFIFKSYIAEIAPQNRLFSLNIEWKTYQKVQFLHEYPQTKQKISRLLFFHHKEAIALYDIPINVCNKRCVMSMQPSTRQIIGNFLWAKFDVMQQRLFFVKLYPQDEEEIHAKAFLTVVEFTPDGEYEYILNFPLPIPFRMECMQQQAVYYENYFSSIVSANSFNLDVITVKPASFYVCFQQPIQTKIDDSFDDEESSKASSSSSLPSDCSTESAMDVTYIICCVHGAYKLQCSVSINHEIVGRKQIIFKQFGDFIIAYLPDGFFHLLDISCEHEPVHNILLTSEQTFMPKLDLTTNENLISQIVEEFSSQNSTLLYDNMSMKFYQFQLNAKNVFRLFLSSKPARRLAILHASMCHFRDRRLTRKLIERVCLDPSNMETTELITEYLISAAYNQMKKMVSSQLDLKIFPFTSCDSSRGQVERNDDGERVVYLFYKHFPDELIKQIQKVLHQTKSVYWSQVYTYMSYAVDHRNKRFPLKLLNLAGMNMNADDIELPDFRRRSASFTTSPNRRMSTENRESKSRTENRESKSRTESTASLPALKSDLKESRECEHKNYVAIQRIISYVVRTYGQETRSKISKMCRQEYASIRIKTINTFWRTVLKALNFSNEDEIYSKSLNDQPTEFELALFQIIERLKFILEQICHPGFPGMTNLFTLLGFRCLPKHQFLQYMDAFMFDINENVVRQILHEADDTPENVSIKKKLISQLPRESYIVLLKEWGNSSSNNFIAQQILVKLPSEEMHYGVSVIEEEGSEPSDEFVPVRTLLHAVKSCTRKSGILRNRNTNAVSDETLNFLAAVVLNETESLISPSER